MKTQEILFFLKKPIIITSLIVIVLSAILLCTVHFQIPDYYTDRIAADAAADAFPSSQTASVTKQYLNLMYMPFNILFLILGTFVSLFLYLFIFKIKTFKGFFNSPLFQNKIFVYLWINLSYIFYATCYVGAAMTDLKKYVYNSAADSMGIPYFTMIIDFVFSALIYYAAVNLLFFIVYNTKIKNILYKIILLALIPYVIYICAIFYTIMFSFYHIGLFLYMFVSSAVLFNAYLYLKDKNYERN